MPLGDDAQSKICKNTLALIYQMNVNRAWSLQVSPFLRYHSPQQLVLDALWGDQDQSVGL